MSFDLYREHILDLYKNPLNRGVIEHPMHEFEKNKARKNEESLKREAEYARKEKEQALREKEELTREKDRLAREKTLKEYEKNNLLSEKFRLRDNLESEKIKNNKILIGNKYLKSNIFFPNI